MIELGDSRSDAIIVPHSVEGGMAEHWPLRIYAPALVGAGGSSHLPPIDLHSVWEAFRGREP